MPVAHVYAGRQVVLASKHDKLALTAPTLGRHLGVHVHEVPVDTDVSGTFTGGTPRRMSQEATANSGK